MIINEIIDKVFARRSLLEDAFVTEMANFIADVTDLPGNIVIWTKTQPEMLPHDKYRMKIYKDRIHCATYSIGQTPSLAWEIGRTKFRLDAYEIGEVKKLIQEYSSLFIQYVDAKLTADEVKIEIQKLKR
jgi:hypothetical protein